MEYSCEISSNNHINFNTISLLRNTNVCVHYRYFMAENMPWGRVLNNPEWVFSLKRKDSKELQPCKPCKLCTCCTYLWNKRTWSLNYRNENKDEQKLWVSRGKYVFSAYNYEQKLVLKLIKPLKIPGHWYFVTILQDVLSTRVLYLTVFRYRYMIFLPDTVPVLSRSVFKCFCEHPLLQLSSEASERRSHEVTMSGESRTDANVIVRLRSARKPAGKQGKSW